MTITDLILDFQNTSKIVAEKFYKKYGTENLLLAVRNEKIIPREGSFDSIKEYSFHGSGLYAKLDDIEIDFDFGPNNRVDGFDAWRLLRFAESKPKIYSIFNSTETIQKELDLLASTGKIHKPQTHPGTSNYYWN